jgi:hypothetical protein
MNTRVLSIILIVLGALALAYQAFTYNKRSELFRVGDASVTATTKETVRIPPYVGFILIGAGAVLLFARPRRP